MNQAGKSGNIANNTDGDPAHGADHLTEEADIGSGEPSPGKQETDEEIKSIPALPKDDTAAPPKP